MTSMTRKALILGLSLIAFAHPVLAAQKATKQPPLAQDSEMIAAVVNNGAITASDVADRRRLIMTSAAMPDTPDMREKVTPQIINMLVDETLMMQEAAKLGVEISDEEVAAGFKTLADQNKFTPGQFSQILAHNGIPRTALDAQIRSQLAWVKVVTRKIRPQIEITEAQIDAALEKMKRDVGKQEYLIAEIYLPVENQQQDQEARQLAERLSAEMKSGKAPFQAVAAQFSQSASAAKGGDKGWVQRGQLPQAVDEALEQMPEGAMSNPIRSLTGYHIVLLRKKREITAETMPTREEVLNKIGDEQLDRLQRRYLLDMKSSAFIERRDT